MRCVICKHGETVPGSTIVVLTRATTTVVFREVPAAVCTNCGEEYVDSDTTARLIEQAENAVQSGVEIDVRRFAA